MYNLEPIDFGRRVAGEKDLIADPEAPHPNAIFDESGNFIIYATMLGIKVWIMRMTCFDKGCGTRVCMMSKVKPASTVQSG